VLPLLVVSLQLCVLGNLQNHAIVMHVHHDDVGCIPAAECGGWQSASVLLGAGGCSVGVACSTVVLPGIPGSGEGAQGHSVSRRAECSLPVCCGDCVLLFLDMYDSMLFLDMCASMLFLDMCASMLFLEMCASMSCP